MRIVRSAPWLYIGHAVASGLGTLSGWRRRSPVRYNRVHHHTVPMGTRTSSPYNFGRGEVGTRGRALESPPSYSADRRDPPVSSPANVAARPSPGGSWRV